MSNQAAWVVTWRAVDAHSPARAPQRERKEFDDQQNAVRFAMSLKRGLRRSAELHLPGGAIVGFPVIEQMYADMISG